MELLLAAVVAVAAFAVGRASGRRATGTPPDPAPAVRSNPATPATTPPPLEIGLRDGVARATAQVDAATVRAAAAAGEFGYHVQPIWDVEARRMIGVEALSRWTRSDGSIVPPSAFLAQIQRAYATGTKPPLNETTATARPFTEAGLFCAFNLSAAFLDRSADGETDWMDTLLDPLDAQRIVFEITEGATISHPDRTARLIDALRERGVRFALDDFGTGLSNLERLQTYPVDFVKVDRRFVQGLAHGRDEGILRALVTLSHDLSFDVIAEGIETEDERDRVQAAGIVLQQGYLHGRPAPVADWAARIDETLES